MATGTVSGGQTQSEINQNMKNLTDKYETLFEGLGKAKIEPVHIEIDPKYNPLQQKKQPITFQHKKLFKQRCGQPTFRLQLSTGMDQQCSHYTQELEW